MGCYARVLRVPGVVDLREDVAAAQAAPSTTLLSRHETSANGQRHGVDALLRGRGRFLSKDGRVHLHDRRWWALGTADLYNADLSAAWETEATPELRFCDVHLREAVEATDVALYIASKAVPVVNLAWWSTPSFTAQVSYRPCVVGASP